ncbi:hypothetical protein CCHR01_19841 [Colletotrichum chrysophilum]|uniref:Uncharacterized protein n=1 Tax=Colletotrichum chrysophilum TaxID=1836956 RepID=A0AAD8ZXQ5_9PEZI|nr:hypothetical protein CCHR01_19841 [Colletotrichum chrysophilum]
MRHDQPLTGGNNGRGTTSSSLPPCRDFSWHYSLSFLLVFPPLYSPLSQSYKPQPPSSIQGSDLLQSYRNRYYRGHG